MSKACTVPARYRTARRPGPRCPPWYFPPQSRTPYIVKPRSGKRQGGSAMQVLVIGAGVVGLAIARTAALAGHDVTVAEATGGIANGVSSRNSEVIHAGLYYPPGSLRARHCTRGRRLMYEFCAAHGVPHRKCGKLVVATNAAELEKVAKLLAQGAG